MHKDEMPQNSATGKRLLLINPKFPESFWTFQWAINEVLPGTAAVNAPLGLATLAGLTPDDWQISIVDENIENIPSDPDVDIIGVCGMGVQYPRQVELLNYYRDRGYYVVAGGSYASLCPEKFEGICDTVIAGEAEYIWPRFCADILVDNAQSRYHETGTVELADSPTPRFDLLKLNRYSNASLQFSRGCPYRCEFCDIIVMFGRRPRVKTLGQIEKELDALRAQDVKRVFFVDDNLIGHRPQVKKLLEFLAEYQRRHDYTFSFGTEASLNLAFDDELLVLFRDANFSWVFIGIETTNEESLKETKKTQNIAGDALDGIRNIYHYGIEVLAGFIIGFDNDTLETFEQQQEFIMQTGIQSAMIGLLHAMPRTPLYERMKREGRLREEDEDSNNTRAGSNIYPKRMDYDSMVLRYQQLYRDLLSDAAISRRMRNKLRYLSSPIYDSGYTLGTGLGILFRLVYKGVIPGGPGRWLAFVRTLSLTRLDLLPTVVSDWIIALSLKDFASRHFEQVIAEGEGTSLSKQVRISISP